MPARAAKPPGRGYGKDCKRSRREERPEPSGLSRLQCNRTYPPPPATERCQRHDLSPRLRWGRMSAHTYIIAMQLLIKRGRQQTGGIINPKYSFVSTVRAQYTDEERAFINKYEI